jgi:hypothetical protein
MDVKTQLSKQAIEDLDEVEVQLEETFKPVIPDPEFIRRLHRRLTTPPVTVLEHRTQAVDLILMALGVLLGAALLAVLGRLIRAMMRHW